ncbi:MAG: hypothetical protein AAF431_13935 [Pseudomonadota bacterium]
MQKLVKIVGAFIAAVVTASILASIFSTQFVIAALQNIGVAIPLGTRLSMTVDDLNILQTLLAVVGACFLVGFIIAGLAQRKLGGNRKIWYLVAGGSALLATLILMNTILQLMPIAGARTIAGLLMQGVAGAVGGWVFAWLSKPKPRRSRYA